MNDVEFERLLSYQYLDGISVRDMINDYMLSMFHDEERAREQTKFFTDCMFEKFVNRKM